ncbi:MAG: serine/threonine protein kinase, partial [Labilithrix sp.]|nr:serine/threonine protein kinase [Labilithrix sp.]
MSVADPFGLVGQVLDGQFRVDKLVGEGGFSAVYRGHHQGLNEPIAIKSLKLPPTLPPSLVDTFIQRFRDESRILYRLSQGNLHIVRSIAAGTTQSPTTGLLVPYMVLEWLEGRSVQNDFTVRRTLGQTGRALDVVLKLFETAADGLAYAHAQGVMHRDLNPGNLFLAQTQQGLKMKVLDFGVAKLMREGALDMGPRAATVGQIKIFAPAYGAPEQFDDRLGEVSAASDVYAFALVLMEALRDRSVNEGAHLGDFAQNACDPDKRPTPRSLGIDVPDDVEAAFARATTLAPADRWQSVGDFWQSLTTASKVAVERRYEGSAREAPPPLGSAAAAPAGGGGQDAKATAKNAARTIPLGASALPRPGAGVTAAAPRPRIPTALGMSPLAPPAAA